MRAHRKDGGGGIGRVILFTCVVLAFVGVSSIALGKEKEKPGGPARLRLEWIGLPADRLWEMVGESPSALADHAALHARLRGMVERGDADLVELVDIDSRLGRGAEHSSVHEIPVPRIPRRLTAEDIKDGRVKPDPVIEDLRDPETSRLKLRPPQRTEIRKVGTTVSAMAKKVGSRWIDLEISAEIAKVGRWAMRQQHRTVEAGEVQPIFFKMSLKASATVPVGEPFLLGAMTPNDGLGHPDRTRKVLLFVRAETEEEAARWGWSPRQIWQPPVYTVATEFVDVDVASLPRLLEVGGGIGQDEEWGYLAIPDPPALVKLALVKEVRRLVDSGKARLRELTVAVGGSRTETAISSVEELAYPAKYEPPQMWPSADPAPPGSLAEALQQEGETPAGVAFYRREVGTVVSVRPRYLVEDPRVDVHQEMEIADFHGDLKFGGMVRPLLSKMNPGLINTRNSGDGLPVLVTVLQPQVRDGDRLVPDPKWRTVVLVRVYLRGGIYLGRKAKAGVGSP